MGGRPAVQCSALTAPCREVARKLKEESEQKHTAREVEPKAEARLTAGLGRIPKFPRKEPKAEGPSFGDLLGGLDTSAKPRAIIKNKNKDLLESLLNSSPNKSFSSSSRKDEKKLQLWQGGGPGQGQGGPPQGQQGGEAIVAFGPRWQG